MKIILFSCCVFSVRVLDIEHPFIPPGMFAIAQMLTGWQIAIDWLMVQQL